MAFRIDLHLVIDCDDMPENETACDKTIDFIESQLLDGVPEHVIMQALAETLISMSDDIKGDTMH
jgi:hypothetical protein|tara:strand:+ start:345 stop:539 length:195 start_codon:yes stop_codon:yes gene_type:complete